MHSVIKLYCWVFGKVIYLPTIKKTVDGADKHYLEDSYARSYTYYENYLTEKYVIVLKYRRFVLFSKHMFIHSISLLRKIRKSLIYIYIFEEMLIIID